MLPNEQSAELILTGSENRNEVKLKDDTSWLSDEERNALELFDKRYQKGGQETYDLSPKTAIEFFSLYLQGNSLTQIYKLNPQFGFGAIVSAAVKGSWNLRKDEYLGDLYQQAQLRVLQSVSEGVNFVADLLTVTHIQEGERFKKYIQDHNPAHLAGSKIGVDSLGQYSKAIEVLMKLTGLDRSKTITVRETREGTPETESKPKEPETPKNLGDLLKIKKKVT